MLWRLQRALNQQADASAPPVLLVGPDSVLFNDGSGIQLDVSLFEEAFFLARGVAGEELAPLVAARLEEAIHLYQGDLLEGWCQDWCLMERERLQHIYMTSLYKLMGFHEARREYEVGIGYGEQILRHDSAHEQAHQRLMRLHYLSGDRTTALRQFDRCTGALDKELDVSPSRSTVDLYQQIRADRLSVLTPAPSASDPENVFQYR